MARRFNQALISGAFVQRRGTAVSCITGLQVSSSFVGHGQIRGIVTVNSGTTVVSVTATGVVSGDTLFSSILQYASGVSSQAGVTTYIESVRAGAFEIRCIGSRAPVGNMPVAWFVIK